MLTSDMVIATMCALENTFDDSMCCGELMGNQEFYALSKECGYDVEWDNMNHKTGWKGNEFSNMVRFMYLDFIAYMLEDEGK